METLNCMRCKYRHEDNGNCTAVGGFCTAVPAAHCPLLREYLDTGLTPGQVVNAKNIIELAFADDTSKAERIRKLLAADDEGRVVVLPCKTVFELTWDAGPDCDLVCPVSIDGNGCCDFCDKGKLFAYERPCCQEHIERLGKTVFLTREEAEKALQEMEGRI